jgi:hypothetical protein
LMRTVLFRIFSKFSLLFFSLFLFFSFSLSLSVTQYFVILYSLYTFGLPSAGDESCFRFGFV